MRFVQKPQRGDNVMRHETQGQKRKIHAVMHEFKAGRLKAGHGDSRVSNPKQAIAIALHEAGVAKKSLMTKRRPR